MPTVLTLLRRYRFVCGLALGTLLWTGCSGSTAVVVGPDVAPEPTVTVAPTPSPAPSATPAPTSSPTPSPTPTSTPFAIAADVLAKLPDGWSPIANTTLQAGPSDEAPSGGVVPVPDYSGSRWKYIGVLGKLKPKDKVVPRVAKALGQVDGTAPLTGLPADLAERPALVVKIDNVPAARPQTGLNQADVVYEELVEAGVTRFAAVFHSSTPDVIGPVRSGRSTDIGIVDSFSKPVFAFSGANSIFDKLIDKQPIFNRGAEVFTGYWRNAGRPAPHNLYTGASTMLNSVGDGEPPRPHFAYRADGDPLPSSAQDATSVRLKYLTGNSVTIEYVWNAEAGTWQRWMAGVRHVDTSGVQLAPVNLIVQFVNYIDTGLTDKWAEDLYEGVSVGTGSALVFTDGGVIEATWTRTKLRSVATFTDTEGNHVELTPGQTHVAMIASGGATWS